MEALATFLKFLKVPIKYIVALFVVDVAALLVPDSVLDKMGLLQYREKAKSYFGLIFAILSVMIVAAIVGIAVEKTHGYFLKRARKQRLGLLTVEEKQILRGYIEGETRTQYLDLRSGVVKGLVHDLIIYRSSNVNVPEIGLMVFSHNIQPWAWEYLNEHRDFLN